MTPLAPADGPVLLSAIPPPETAAATHRHHVLDQLGPTAAGLGQLALR